MNVKNKKCPSLLQQTKARPTRAIKYKTTLPQIKQNCNAIMASVMIATYAIAPVGAAAIGYCVIPGRTACVIPAREPVAVVETVETVKVITGNFPVVVLPIPERNFAKAYTDEELEMLALVIYQEAGGNACTDETRLMVGQVVLNRVADDRYPNTIEEVVTQKAQYGRLYWTGLVWPERASHETEKEAVERAYKCAEMVLNGEKLLPDDVIYQAEFCQGSEVIAHSDGFYFCR